MLGKLSKMGKKMGEKVSTSAAKAKAAVTHKVNAQRSHKELRDVITETKELHRFVTMFVKKVGVAFKGAIDFMTESCVVEESLSEKSGHADLKAQEDLTTHAEAMKEWSTVFKTLLDKAIEAEKAAPAPAEGEEKEGVDVEPLYREYIKDAIVKYGQSFGTVFTEIVKLYGERLKTFETIPSAFPPDFKIPFEQLWDEPRPAVGASPASAPKNADGTKMLSHVELASFPRPVDGDTRAKYAKMWNTTVRETLENFREVEKALTEWIECVGRIGNYFTKWAEVEESAIVKTAATYMTTHHNQFLNVHLVEFKGLLNNFTTAMEAQVAHVPQVGQPMPTAKLDVPRARQATMKAALQGAAHAMVTFAYRVQTELQMLSGAAAKAL